MIPYGRQSISQEDVESVVEVLRSDWLTQGPTVRRFEETMAERCGARYAVAVSSATAGLHLGCLALGLEEGDSLWTSPNTFVASANCARYCGADVDFVDIDPLTYNMDVPDLRKRLEAARDKGNLPKVVVPVHFSGQSCDMEGIAALAKEFGFKIMEDASHAVGADYKERPVGCGAFSDLTIFSFHPVKIMTTGEGGMVLTNDEALYKKLVALRQHGITRDESLMENGSDGPWYYEQHDLGLNYRITDFQCALGLSQLSKLDGFLKRRRALAARYDELLKDLPVRVPFQKSDGVSSWHLYVIRVETTNSSKTHRTIFESLREAGIGVQLHYIPVHLQPYYRKQGFGPGDFPEAERYYGEAITLPLFPAMTDAEQDEVVTTLEKILL